MIKQAIYPGTFDPMTNGHLDVIKRSLKIFDKLTVLLAKNYTKKTLFSTEERLDQITRVLKAEGISDSVTVDTFDGLLVDYCRAKNINTIVRGLRPFIDFEYEFEMAMTNRELNNDVETVFILTEQKYFYLRSTLIKDIAIHNGDISTKIPAVLQDEFLKRIQNQ